MNNNIKTLSRLYFNYIFNKMTSIIIIISMIMVLLFLLLFANINFNNYDYMLVPYDIHKNYFNIGLVIVELLNLVIITTIIITLTINSISFDSLFISYTKRYKLCISKLIAIIILILFLSIYEGIIMLLIALIRYPLFKINYIELLLIIYLFLTSLLEAIIMLFFTTIISNIFIPMLSLFIMMVVKIMINNSKDIKELLNAIIGIISYDNRIIAPNIYLNIIWIYLIGILYILAYSNKNLKIN